MKNDSYKYASKHGGGQLGTLEEKVLQVYYADSISTQNLRCEITHGTHQKIRCTTLDHHYYYC